MTQSSGETSIACTLNDQEYKDRRQYVREELLPHVVEVEAIDERTSTTSALPVGLKLLFNDTAELRGRLEYFADMERQCCEFLTYTITTPGEGLALTIEGPLQAKPILDAFMLNIAKSEACNASIK
ncbi:MAG: hypothetical protein COA96_03025 [SAR86 cluster bacterium]|uniref:Uncharacterized protein n=1 Tax=SAR86 cluster bacterium TaxID=2030880 RepID=A0A2A5B901_9GAMM|nr:MAG: hypothetical protein COA96_03025 [SAR86 cluster bacterium]